MLSPQRILILRTDRIGDAVLFSGALAPLRARWPEARIDLMVPPQVRPLFVHCPHIDRLPGTGRLFPWEAWQRTLSRGGWAWERLLLRAGVRRWWYPRYDLAIYPVSAPIELGLRAMRFLEAGEKWGYGGDQLRWTDLEDEANQPERVFTHCYRNRPEDRWQHEIERTKAFLTAMGVPAGDLKPELWLSAGERRYAERALPGRGVLGLFLGAGDRLRQWPPTCWSRMALRQDVSRDLALFGGPENRALALELKERCSGAGLRVTNLVGSTRLGELAACIGRCRALVSNDSSGLHLAVAQGVPAVGILGGYHFGRFYPWGDPTMHRVANVPMDCYHCNDACRYGDWRCVRDVPVDTVVSELSMAVGGGGRGVVGGR